MHHKADGHPDPRLKPRCSPVPGTAAPHISREYPSMHMQMRLRSYHPRYPCNAVTWPLPPMRRLRSATPRWPACQQWTSACSSWQIFRPAVRTLLRRSWSASDAGCRPVGGCCQSAHAAGQPGRQTLCPFRTCSTAQRRGGVKQVGLPVPASVTANVYFRGLESRATLVRQCQTEPVLAAGVEVAGCTGRGVFGILPDGSPAEIDPAASRTAGISLLLGRVPGAVVRTFAAGPLPESESCLL